MSELDIERDVPLAPLTTLELGGSASYFVRAERERTVVDALRWARAEGIPAAILAGGSNLVVPDAGYRGLVIQMAIGDLAFHHDGRVQAGAGVPWEAVVEGALARKWAGIECLTGIPGSTGATPIQNVGAYGQEVSEVVERVRVIDRDDLEVQHLAPAECGFDYRTSRFKQEPTRFVVTGVDFVLREAGKPMVRYAELERSLETPSPSLDEVRSTVLELRRQKSMVLDPQDPNRRSAGSFFLNPVVRDDEARRIVEQALREGLVHDPAEVPRYRVDEGRTKLAAGWLIERSGITKGTRRGAIGISTRHALALVHHGGGTTAELLDFAEDIRRRVESRFGVRLEQEPRLLE
jgi:UDP-N-acetylmuramate dehydrogenase